MKKDSSGEYWEKTIDNQAKRLRRRIQKRHVQSKDTERVQKDPLLG